MTIEFYFLFYFHLNSRKLSGMKERNGASSVIRLYKRVGLVSSRKCQQVITNRDTATTCLVPVFSQNNYYLISFSLNDRRLLITLKGPGQIRSVHTNAMQKNIKSREPDMFNRQGVVLLGNVAHWPGDIYRPTVCVYLNMNIT